MDLSLSVAEDENNPRWFSWVFQARVQDRPGHAVAGAVHDSDVHPDGPGRGQQGMDGGSRLRRRHGVPGKGRDIHIVFLAAYY